MIENVRIAEGASVKNVIVAILAPAITVIAAALIFLITSGAPIVPVVPECGLSVSDGLSNAGAGELKTGDWEVYSFGGDYGDPVVHARPLKHDVVTELGGKSGCNLSIEYLPPSSATGTDWRIGRRLIDASPFRGKIVKYSVRVRASQDVPLTSSEVYIYDGKNVVTKPIVSLSGEWQTYESIARVPKNAALIEFWFRLFLGTPDKFLNGVDIDFSAKIEEGTEGELSLFLSGVHEKDDGNSWSESQCQTNISEQAKVALGDSVNLGHWMIYAYDGNGKAPSVETEFMSGFGPNGENVCRLYVSAAPTIPASALDWRIGKVSDAAIFPNGTVTYKALLRADRSTKLTSSYIYLHDGEATPSEGVEFLGPQWIERTVTLDVTTDSQTVETWYRLVFDQGTVVPGDVIIDFIPILEIESN